MGRVVAMLSAPRPITKLSTIQILTVLDAFVIDRPANQPNCDKESFTISAQMGGMEERNFPLEMTRAELLERAAQYRLMAETARPADRDALIDLAERYEELAKGTTGSE
jgi:hypothetical protein